MSESEIAPEIGEKNDVPLLPSLSPATATKTTAATVPTAATSSTNTSTTKYSKPLAFSSIATADNPPPMNSSRTETTNTSPPAKRAPAVAPAYTATVNTATATSTTAAATTAPVTASAPSLLSAAPTNTNVPKQRLYRSADGSKWVTREIAALGFLLGIPLEAEGSIVKQGWLLQQQQLREKNNKDGHINSNMSSIMDESGHFADDSYHYNGTATAAAKGHWWEKWVHELQGSAAVTSPRGGGDLNTPRHGATYETELERPSAPPAATSSNNNNTTQQTAFYNPPGRRLEGDEAVRVQIPLTTRTLTKQRYIARQAALRQWELQTAHGITTTTTTSSKINSNNKKTNQNSNNNNNNNATVGTNSIIKGVPSTPGTTTTSSTISLTSASAATTNTTNTTTTTRTYIPPLLDGRLFFSAGGSYPVSVFSVIRYEPRKEELLRRRQKLEAMGGGGSQFVMPTRDWRGISYRSLLIPRLRDNNNNNMSSSSKKKKPHHHHHHRHHASKSHHHHRHRRPKNFNRFMRSQNEDEDDQNPDAGGDNDNGINASRHSKQSNKSDNNDDSSTSGSESSSLYDDSDDDVVYAPGILDDPNMVLGRHRTVMIGDRVTGPMVSSTIQFVKPALLKAELNKQFRERFDGWEPPRAARKYIGARVVDGAYKLMDPKEQSDDYHTTTTTTTSGPADADNRSWGNRQGSIASASSASEANTGGGGGTTAAPTLSKEKQLRMPPSLTLSKIRSLKRQALAACVKARLEIGTVALACVYFERLCLDCRVDKSNRRLSFAACLLLAAKLNEPNVGLVIKNADGVAPNTNNNNNNSSSNDNMSMRLQSLIRPNRQSRMMFASLLEFFTEDWNLALPVLFSAEWGVFAALGFSLHAKPSQVSFHFKRLMKTLEWNPRHYLGSTMFHQWQDALDFEEERNKKRERRKEKKRQRKEEQLLNLHIELVSLKTGDHDDSDGDGDEPTTQRSRPSTLASSTQTTTTAGLNASNTGRQEKSSAQIISSGMRLLNRFGMRRILSQDKIDQQLTGSMMSSLNPSDHLGRRSTHQQRTNYALTVSPSLPTFGSAAVAAAAPTPQHDGVVEGTGIIAIDIPATAEVASDASSIGSVANSDKGIII